MKENQINSTEHYTIYAHRKMKTTNITKRNTTEDNKTKVINYYNSTRKRKC